MRGNSPGGVASVVALVFARVGIYLDGFGGSIFSGAFVGEAGFAAIFLGGCGLAVSGLVCAAVLVAVSGAAAVCSGVSQSAHSDGEVRVGLGGVSRLWKN
jgi:hypothetical protein